MNILLITNSDPANEAAGNEQRTAALHRALCRCGTVYTLLPVKKPKREFLDAARRVQGLCLLPPSRWGLRLARALWRACFRHLPLPFVWEPARRKAFPGVRFDVVVTRYLTVAAETRAWAFGPCRVDIDDFPDESYATGLAKRHGRLRRAIHLWAIRTWMAWVCGHLEGAWATNAQRVGTLPGLPMVALPNIARPPAPAYAFDAPRRDVLLTVGQMAYPPNHEGVDRFLAEIWPSVRAAFPRLTYRIVGRGAPEACQRRWKATPGVEVAGFVEDLDAAYASALACVAPVDAGSGRRPPAGPTRRRTSASRASRARCGWGWARTRRAGNRGIGKGFQAWMRWAKGRRGTHGASRRRPTSRSSWGVPTCARPSTSPIG